MIEEFQKVERNFFSLLSQDHVNTSTMHAYATGVKAAGLNPTLVNQIDGSFSANLENCSSFFEKTKLPWTLGLPEHLHDETIKALLHQVLPDFEICEKGVAMYIPTTDLIVPNFSSPLIIKDMKEDLETWSFPVNCGFGSKVEDTKAYTARHQLAVNSKKGLYYFSGFIDGKAVCSLTLSLYEGFARIDDVATIPSHQKKGYATQLIYSALKLSHELKANTCFLEATSAGLKLYEEIGFKELFTNLYYEKKANE